MAPLTILITGSSSGLGLSLTRHFLTQGHNVLASSRNPSGTPSLVSEITSQPNGRWLTLDVTSPSPIIFQTITTVTSSTQHGFGTPIDVLINNAGYSVLGAVEAVDEAVARAQFEVNFWGVLKLIQAVVPGMRERGKGTVVNVSSIAGLQAGASTGSYAASKFAVEGILSKSHPPLVLEGLGWCWDLRADIWGPWEDSVE
jgi:NAD(P)-dependent dehydrogenase (short-subunit alcohol dehydrogenase family)